MAEPSSEGVGLVVVCAANEYDSVKVADQHLAEHLARHVPVLYVDPPRSHFTGRHDGKLTLRRDAMLRQIDAQLWRTTPVVPPFPSRRAIAPTATVLARRWVAHAVDMIGIPVSAVISAWPSFPILGAVGELVSIYWAQDDFVGGAELFGLDAVQLEKREQRSAAPADLVIAANPIVDQLWQGRGYPTRVIPFGCCHDQYVSVEAPRSALDVRLPRPVVGLVGRLNDRIDLGLLEAIAARGRSLLLVGPRSRGFESARLDSLIARPNVTWVGEKPFRELPDYLSAIDVGIVPYGDSAFNRGSFPLKSLEYLAAGLPVVATDLPAIRWLDSPLIAIASDPQAFAHEVDVAAACAHTPELVGARRALAARHSWARRAQEFLAVIEHQKCLGSGSPSGGPTHSQRRRRPRRVSHSTSSS